ncbi:GIP, partial [Symbiodinium sp. CCMP2456]
METPVEAFERLRQALNVLKDHHYDPWNWHEYLSDEPEEGEEEEEEEEELFKDLEMLALKPKRRKNIDKLKAHLLTVVQELNRAGHAADLAYYYMSVQPQLMKECVVIMGVAGDIDEDLLNESGDASPEKIMAALQAKLDAAHERIEELTDEVTDLKKRLKQKTEESEDRWGHWQRSKMQGEEAMQRLDETTRSLMLVLEREGKLAAAY